ncbi:MFS transporter [Salinisphaera aquimarina]|uniref:MFS transporter n=1 Tax=Salinisphaera aquimarina TaxID=2094031 RepID=A0ABV7ENQ5_9GAMM
MTEPDPGAPTAPPSAAADPDRLAPADLFAAVASSILSSLAVFLVAALALQIGDSLDFGAASLGFLVSLYYLSAALTSIPLSRLVEAIGSLRAMRWGCALMGMLLILAGAAPNFPCLLIVIALAGAVSAGVQPATNLFIVRRIPSAHQGFALGIKQAAVPIAVLIAGLSVPAIALTIGWRWGFIIAAVIAFATSMALPPSRSSLAEYRAHPPTVKQLGRSGVNSLVLLAVGFGLGVAAASALSAFAVTAVVAANLGHGTAGLVAGLGGCCAAVVRVGIGIHADRSRSPHLVVVASMLGLGAIAYLMLAASTLTVPALLIPGIMLAFGAGWGWNGLFNLAVVRRYPTQAARATGITSVGARAGGVIGPAVFGVVVTHGSYTWAWLIAAASAMLGASIILFGRRMLDSDPALASQQQG